MCGMVAGRTPSATKENGPGGLRRAGAAGSAGWPSLNARLSPESPVSRPHVLRQALPAVPARRRPPRRLSVGRLKACCLDDDALAVALMRKGNELAKEAEAEAARGQREQEKHRVDYEDRRTQSAEAADEAGADDRGSRA